ncbi:hypothetical protein OsccyDRAFT_1750 [Leptolyngbyaceae cyanobacterium JSC-12]|nr:hypothetical protein OsccyDRAFT_1750 [Leptolyngbyaceae cyanobacterium JSC-12]
MLSNTEINPPVPGEFEAACLSERETPLPKQTSASYKDRLNRWAIARIGKDKKPEIVARFRSRSDADGHLKFFQQRSLNEKFVILFEKQAL